MTENGRQKSLGNGAKSGKNVMEKSGNFEIENEWQPCSLFLGKLGEAEMNFWSVCLKNQ